MSWMPSNDPVLGDPKTCDALELDHRAAHPRPRRRLCGAARAAAWQAADGRPLHLLRSFRPGAVHGRQGHGRAAASAYRACHRHLSVRRHHHASRQRGQHPGDPARRDEPDDGRPRHRAFRAHARTCSARDGQKMLGLQSWIALPTGTEEIAPSFQHYAAGESADGHGQRLYRAHHRGLGVRRGIAGEMVSPWFYIEVTAEAGTIVPLDPDHEERAIYRGRRRGRDRQRAL